jgi:IclR family pca regulon transcriptional regulator
LPTAVGRVLLAGLPQAEVDRLLRQAPIIAHTALTVTDTDRLLDLIAETRERGWTISDQELEIGIRTAAAPIRSKDGTIVAAVNVATHSSRIGPGELVDDVLPQVLETADAIAADLHELG